MLYPTTVFVGDRVTVSSAEPALSGHVFLGWSLSPDSDTADLRAGDTVTVTEHTTLYAVWEEIVLPPEPPSDEETAPLPESNTEGESGEADENQELKKRIEKLEKLIENKLK